MVRRDEASHLRPGFPLYYKRHAETLLGVDDSVGRLLAELERGGVRKTKLNPEPQRCRDRPGSRKFSAPSASRR